MSHGVVLCLIGGRILSDVNVVVVRCQHAAHLGMLLLEWNVSECCGDVFVEVANVFSAQGCLWVITEACQMCGQPVFDVVCRCMM